MNITVKSFRCPATNRDVMIEEQIFSTPPAGRSGKVEKIFMYSCREVSCNFRNTETCPIQSIQNKGEKFRLFQKY